MVCGWGGFLCCMKEYGNVLLIGKEKEEFGILVFDVIFVLVGFVVEESEIFVKFLKVMVDVNVMWNFGENIVEMLLVIVKDVGMFEVDIESMMVIFEFLNVED